MHSINSHPSAEKFHLLSTVWFVLREQVESTWLKNFHYINFEGLWATLFGFDSRDISWDRLHYDLMRHPEFYMVADPLGAIYGHTAETNRLLPGHILAHRLSRVAISCMKYLFRCRTNTQDHILAWAMKSKRSPWLLRWRMRVTLTRRQPHLHYPVLTYLFPERLRQLRRVLYSERIQSKRFYLLRYALYGLTLDLLYLTLRKARKSDELTRALSNSFIPLSASFLFPRRIKRVTRAINAYLEKVSRRACFNFEK